MLSGCNIFISTYVLFYFIFYYVVHHHCRFCVRTGSERGITARSLSEPAVRRASLPVLCQNRQWWCTLLTPARRPFCRHLPLPLLFLSSSSPLLFRRRRNGATTTPCRCHTGTPQGEDPTGAARGGEELVSPPARVSAPVGAKFLRLGGVGRSHEPDYLGVP